MSDDLASLTLPAGFRAAGGAFGIKASGKPDLALIAADAPCPAAAVFTTNAVPSEPVLVGREHLAGGRLRAIVCNAGNANAATGARGMADARAMCDAVAQRLGCRPAEVLACSTGIIGEHLPMAKVLPGIAALADRLDRGPGADADAARAIMTTDLVPKAARRTVRLGGRRVRLAGIAKGSGMIAPDMATMLAFLTTDADATPAVLRDALRRAVDADASFNRITVDQHTSPSDTVAILASGGSGAGRLKKGSADHARFADALADLCRDLAYQIVKDGEGATRVIRVRVEGAASAADAVRVARAVADSPLVKTAVHGGDPNWGRIVTAAGYAGAKLDPAKLSLRIGRSLVFRAGQPTRVNRPAVERAMTGSEVIFTLSLGLGDGATECLGCDLGREYVTINADYHT